MKNLFIFLKKNVKEIKIISLFLLTAMIIILLFPGEGKFSYEFQKGKPWMHDEYIAPFNFPIVKYENEIAAERDSILREFKPYFSFNGEVVLTQLEKFDEAFELQWKRYFTDEKLNSREGRRIYSNPEGVKNHYRKFSRRIINFVYQKGIVGIQDILERVDNQDLTIVILRDQMAEELNYAEVFTQKAAYQYVINRLNEFSDSLISPADMNFFHNLNINEFLVPNLFYDEATSAKVKTELTQRLSSTRGMVQSGERIISRGELVTAEKFRVLESLKREYELNMGFSERFDLISLGKVILILISMVVLYLFLYNFRVEVLQDSLKTSFILLLVVIMVVASRLTLKYDVLSLYVLPFAIVPIMIRTFFDARLALFIHLILLLIVGFWAPNSFEFVFLNLIAGIVAIFSLTNSYRRGILFLTSVLIILTYSLVLFSFSIIQEGNLASIDYKSFLWFGGNGLLILSAYPLIFIFEKTFKFLSDSTLIELADSNQPLLRELQEKAPGTFQHSLQVGNLAEEAIFRTGGNALLVRTGALYHDIGKMLAPQYFVENQNSDVNPHDKLDFDESARIIIGHVEKGIEIAKKHRLPEPIIDFIRTHHGDSVVQYFYRSFLKKYPEISGNMDRFSYSGPKPFSRETAVLMMADSVEAASRSLPKKNEESLAELIDNIIDHQIKENQFDNAPITFRDITQIKEIFLKKLLNIYHVRIEYPE